VPTGPLCSHVLLFVHAAAAPHRHAPFTQRSPELQHVEPHVGPSGHPAEGAHVAEVPPSVGPPPLPRSPQAASATEIEMIASHLMRQAYTRANLWACTSVSRG
jgi:hypothetical protein